MELTVESVFREPELLCQETARAEALPSKTVVLALQATAGGALYGLTMGMNHSIEQALVSAVKVPLLFLLTLGICLPALHFVGLLFGARARVGQTLTLLLAGVSLTCTLLAAFTPISLLFLASGSTYPFLLAMHVTLFAFCGAAGLRSIHQNFERLRAAAPDSGVPLSVAGLQAWGVLYMFVGAQTAFLLSPFIARDVEFHLFNPHHGSVFSYLLGVLLG